MTKKIVVIGGGNGSATTINALKQHRDEFEISAVISMSDSGGSSGRLRQEFKTLPPGDILRAILAMSPHDYKFLKSIFYKPRFENVGKLDKHNLGNLFLVLSEQYSGDYMAPIRALEQSLQAVGKVYPVTLEQTDLVVELDNGDIVRTEGVIDRPDYDRQHKIKKAWLEPEGEIFPDAKKVIEEADYIIIGSGSLYCSIIAALLPKGVKEAIANSSAKLIYTVGNAYEIDGETGPEELSGFVRQLQDYLPRKLDAIIYNNYELNEVERKNYGEKDWATFTADLENLAGYNIIQGDYEKEEGKGAGLSPVKLGNLLKDYILNE